MPTNIDGGGGGDGSHTLGFIKVTSFGNQINQTDQTKPPNCPPPCTKAILQFGYISFIASSPDYIVLPCSSS